MAALLVSVPSHSLTQAIDYVRNGGRLAIPTYTRLTLIDKKTLIKFEKAGCWLLKEDGEGYRMASGRSSVYLMAGQLKFVQEGE